MEEIRIMEAGPKGFRGALLDELLAKGYFRDGRKMVAKDSQQDGYYGRSPMFYWVCMLRYPVADYSPSATMRNIRNRCAKFELTLSPGVVTEEAEALYRRYRESVDFELPGSLKVHLHDGEIAPPFDTSVMEVRDGGRLIAAGFLDRGSDSCVGVLNIYDPDYERYSLGKYLIDRKIEMARSEGLRYFYPGPVIISNDRLDYKLSFDREHVEVFLSADGVWEPFRKHGKAGMEKYLFKKNMDIDFDDIFPDEGKEGQG
jgi:arginine-tRNA-protein transferase